jgi:deazaflavin-dependent oxidoreductase (nitroreductase family)
VTGRRTGRPFVFPVMAAPLGPSTLVVVPGHPERKTWWRNLEACPEVEVLDRGTFRPAYAELVRPGPGRWSQARQAYAARWPHARIGAGLVVVIELQAAEAAGDQGPAEAGPGAVGAAASAP